MTISSERLEPPAPENAGNRTPALPEFFRWLGLERVRGPSNRFSAA